MQLQKKDCCGSCVQNPGCSRRMLGSRDKGFRVVDKVCARLADDLGQCCVGVGTWVAEQPGCTTRLGCKFEASKNEAPEGATHLIVYRSRTKDRIRLSFSLRKPNSDGQQKS